MKALILTLLTLSASASICDSSLGQINYPDDNQEVKFKVISESNEKLEEELFLSLPEINETSYEECADSIATDIVREISTGKIYTLYYTVEDHCDGGNSMGAFTNASGEVIGEIHDGDFYCHE